MHRLTEDQQREILRRARDAAYAVGARALQDDDTPLTDADRAFIAAARDDVFALEREVRDLRAELAAAHERLGEGAPDRPDGAADVRLGMTSCAPYTVDYRLPSVSDAPGQRPGYTWRTLVQTDSGTSVHVQADGTEGVVFDELVIDQWFHLEQMDEHYWWLGIGRGLMLNITPRPDGSCHVMIEDDGDPTPGAIRNTIDAYL